MTASRIKVLPYVWIVGAANTTRKEEHSERFQSLTLWLVLDHSGLIQTSNNISGRGAFSDAGDWVHVLCHNIDTLSLFALMKSLYRFKTIDFI